MLASVDTIAAIASAPGRSATGVIRLSGPASLGALRTALGEAVETAGARSGRFGLGDGRSVAVRVVVFRAPASYTGEDAVELYAPGNPALLERILERLCEREGVRLASPGEFTQRAFLHGKLSLEQTEGVAAMIAASGEDELLAAQRLLSGQAGEAQRGLAEACAELLALVEAGVDFADQEGVAPIAPGQLRDRLASLELAIERAGGEAASRTAPGARAARVVIAGAPNAGKSTLFNALLGRKRALVSAQPGATRDALEEPLDLSAQTPVAPEIVLVDMAGLDEALAQRSRADAAAQQKAQQTLDDADVVLHCDPAGRFALLPGVDAAAITLRVRTKADLEQFAPFFGGMGVSPVPSVQARARRPRRQGAGALAVCALDGWRLGALKRAIADAASAVGRASALARVAPRHAQALARALGAVRQARELARQSPSDQPALAQEELIAHWLRQTLDALGEISGKTPPDDVLGRIFASFCVGK